MSGDSGFAARLHGWARSDPGRTAILEPVPRGGWPAFRRAGWRGVTFAELDRLADRYASRLERAGIREGDRTLYLLQPSIQGYAVFYGLLRVGAVPVFIDPRMPPSRLFSCVAEARPRVLVGTPAVQILRRFARRPFATTEIALTSGSGWLGALRLEDGLVDVARSGAGRVPATAVCYIAYTSGSTGTAKGVPYTHRMVSAQMDVVHEVCDWSAGMQVVMCFAPFLPYALGDGLTAILPMMDFSRPGAASPARVVEAVLDHSATCAFASPTIWGNVAAWSGARQVALRPLTRAVTVGAPVQASLHRHLVPLLHPQGRLYTPYGATEAMPIATAETGTLEGTWDRTREGYGTCVGTSVAGVEVQVIRVTDAPIAEWSDILAMDSGGVGELVVEGGVVSPAYLERPLEDERAKIRHGARVLHRTGDLGRLDGQGRIWFCGRKSQRVETGDAMLPADAVENVFNEHPLVTRSALVGVGPRGGQVPVLCLELAGSARLTPALATELAAQAGQTPYAGAVRHFLQHPRFPLDARHNAKILREVLSEWAARRLRRGVRL